MDEQNNLTRKAKVNVGTSIEQDIWILATNNSVMWNKALTCGIYEQLLEKRILDISEVPENFYTKLIKALKMQRLEMSKELQTLKGEDVTEVTQVSEEEAKEEADDILDIKKD